MALLDKAKLSEDDLEKASGGYVFHGEGVKGFEVIDDHDGHVITTFETGDEARDYCYEHGLSPHCLYWYQVEELRNKSRR